MFGSILVSLHLRRRRPDPILPGDNGPCATAMDLPSRAILVPAKWKESFYRQELHFFLYLSSPHRRLASFLLFLSLSLIASLESLLSFLLFLSLSLVLLISFYFSFSISHSPYLSIRFQLFRFLYSTNLFFYSYLYLFLSLCPLNLSISFHPFSLSHYQSITSGCGRLKQRHLKGQTSTTHHRNVTPTPCDQHEFKSLPQSSFPSLSPLSFPCPTFSLSICSCC